MQPQPSADELEQVAGDSLQRYWRAVELVDNVLEAWVDGGKVLTVCYANGIEAEAPLLKLLRECERDAARLARDLRPPRRPGRQPTAVPKPRSARLRAVNGEKPDAWVCTRSSTSTTISSPRCSTGSRRAA